MEGYACDADLPVWQAFKLSWEWHGGDNADIVPDYVRARPPQGSQASHMMSAHCGLQVLLVAVCYAAGLTDEAVRALEYVRNLAAEHETPSLVRKRGLVVDRVRRRSPLSYPLVEHSAHPLYHSTRAGRPGSMPWPLQNRARKLL